MSSPDRRRFLGLLAGGLAAGATIPHRAAELSPRARLDRLSRASQDDDEAYWRIVKREFPAKPGLAMMNAANLCPSPFVVIDTVTQLTRDVDADVSFQNRSKFGPLKDQSRQGLAAHLGADPSEIAITRNTSESNNTVVNGLPLGRGDEVVLWDQNHPTNNVSWDVRAERMGYSVNRVTTPTVPQSANELAAVFVDALTPRTKVLSFSHVSNVSGIRLPARQLCRIARERGILTLVDGAQTFGALHVNLHDMGCDFYTGSAHKWFVGPKEAGVLYVREDRIADLWANDVGVGWQGAIRNGAQKFENLGQRDDACVAAIGTAAEFHATIGIDRIDKRVKTLATALIEQLQDRIPGVTFTTPLDPDLRAGVVIFAVPGVDHGELYGRLYTDFHIAGARRATGVRLCPHLYNTMEEIDRAVAGAAAIGGV